MYEVSLDFIIISSSESTTIPLMGKGKYEK